MVQSTVRWRSAGQCGVSHEPSGRHALVAAALTPDFQRPISNYAPNAGCGSQNLSCSATWRAALLGTVAAAAAMVGYARSARANCAGPATTLTCNGVIAGTAAPGVVNSGIVVPGGYNILNVNSITANITPAAGTNGILFLSAGSIAITSNTGTHDIITAGGASLYGNGIRAYSTGSGVTVDHTGDIIATAGTSTQGVRVGNNNASALDVTTNGNVSARYSGILVRSYGALGSADITIDSTGNVSSTLFAGIGAINYAGTGAVSITSTGDVSGPRGAIIATSAGGNATVDSTGTLTAASGRGISATSGGAGDVSVTSNGAITSLTDGIYATSSSGAVSVDSSGDILSSTYTAIVARNSGSTSVTVANAGNLQASFRGISVTSSAGSVTVNSTGNISAANGQGILALNYGSNAVSVVSTGDILSTRQAIFASSTAGNVSVGAAGTMTSTNSNAIVAFNSGAGTVSVVTNGSISAHFDGIYARSTTGAITIDATGDITSAANDAVRSRYGSSSSVTLRGGTVIGADDGVEFVGGGANTLRNYASLSGGSLAVQGGTGNETVRNYGVVTGNVDLGAGSNAFLNSAGGTFRSGGTVNLGAGNTLTNSGTLTPGGTGTVQTTALTGNLVQTGSGRFVVDIDQGGAGADRVTVSGTANFAGTVAPNVINQTTKTGAVQIATASNVTNAATAVDTLTVDYYLSVLAGSTELWLNWQPAVLANLLTVPLTPNQQATADYIDALTLSGPSPSLQDVILALKGLPNEAAILAALDRLHPEHYLAQVEDTLRSNLFFLNNVMSCPTAGGANAFVAEDQCVWAKLGGRTVGWDRTRMNIGGDSEAWNVSGGVQVALQDNWRLGAALSYENSNIETNNAASSEGDRVEGALILKNRWGNTSLAAAAFGGSAWFKTERAIGLAGIEAAHGEQEIDFGGVHSRLSYLFDQGGWYLKPMIDLNATYLDFGGFQEHGAGAVNLNVRGEQEWVLSVRPALEIGAEMRINAAILARPFMRVGGTFFDNNDFGLTSSFLGAPAGVGPFTINSKFDEAFLDVSVGVDVLSADGLEVKLNYDGHFSNNSEQHDGGIKVGVKF